MPLSTETVQIIIQGGAVGILLFFGYCGYKLSGHVLSIFQNLIGNHLNSLTKEVRNLNEKMDSLIDALLRQRRD